MARRFDLDCVYLADDFMQYLTLSDSACHICQGVGSRLECHRLAVCNCVFRSVFRRCLGAYRSFSVSPGPVRLSVGHDLTFYSSPSAEYIADFELITRRVLTGMEATIMECHFYDGLPWRQCLAALSAHHTKVDRGLFFHSVFRIEQKLGRRFLLNPKTALYPLSRYVASSASHATSHKAFDRPRIQRWRDEWLNGGYFQPVPSDSFTPLPRRKIIQRQVNEVLIRRIGPNGAVTELPLAPTITQALAALQTSGGHPALLE
jgi:hypothetical protein